MAKTSSVQTAKAPKGAGANPTAVDKSREREDTDRASKEGQETGDGQQQSVDDLLQAAASREKAVEGFAEELSSSDVQRQNVQIEQEGLAETSALSDEKTIVADGSDETLDAGRAVERHQNHKLSETLFKEALEGDEPEKIDVNEFYKEINKTLEMLQEMQDAQLQPAPTEGSLAKQEQDPTQADAQKAVLGDLMRETGEKAKNSMATAQEAAVSMYEQGKPSPVHQADKPGMAPPEME